MKTLLKFIILVVLISACAEKKQPLVAEAYKIRDSVNVALTEFSIANTTIRALEVLNDSAVWFCGGNSRWGYTLNNGQSWKIDSLKHEGKTLELRSIKVLENGDVFLVSVSEPAVVYKSKDKGETWKLVYHDTSSVAFFDAVNFWDNQNGMLLGDALDGCFHLAITKDGGETWQKVSCENIPEALEGEGPFAASNTNIALRGKKAWFATGGKLKSRLFYSDNYAKTWKVRNTPIVSGLRMSGIFSLDFYNDSLGIVAGGNWENVEENTNNFAFTKDGGLSWQMLNGGKTDGYISCVQFIPETEGKEIFALKGRARGGESSMSFSNDGGETWQVFPNSNYLAVKFANKNVAWISGKNKIARLNLCE